MKPIAITPETPMSDEAAKISLILSTGWWRVHLRHPGCDAEAYGSILSEIPAELLSRITVHDHFPLLCNSFPGIGCQVNSRQSAPGQQGGERVVVSRSCHSVAELLSVDFSSTAYATLSPIFASISKPGYRGAFSEEDLAAISGAQVPVIALGGVSSERIPMLRRYNFSGFAMLGAIPWEASRQAIKSYSQKIIALC